MSRVCEYKGTGLTWARVCFPSSGLWIADLRLESKVALPNYLTFRLHDLNLSGTVMRSASGDFLDTSCAKVIGGKGAWKTKLGSNHFRGGGAPGFLKSATLIDDIQRLTGETIEVQPGVLRSELTVTDYVRVESPAFRNLIRIIEECASQDPGPNWWVRDDGVTQIGYRTVQDAKKGSYDVLSYDPSLGVVELACYELSQVRIGSRIMLPDNQSLTVKEIQINISGDKTRMICWV